MEKLKIVINGNEDIAKEASGLFEELGYYVSSGNKNNLYGWSLGENQGDYYINKHYFNIDAARLVTIEELRALVSLHKNPINMDKVLSGVRSDALGLLEDKPVKEYLIPNDGNYKYQKAYPITAWKKWIEIPEGADYYAKDSSNGFKGEFFFRLRSDGFDYGAVYLEGKWMNAVFSVDGQEVLWQRHTQPEELPFVDDELSLNDQYAEIEKVRQESQTWSNLPAGSCQTVPIDEASLPDFLIEDTVNHPSHYASSSIECIDAMEAMLTPEQFIGYLRGNAFKYQWRYENKGGITDLEKAQWYLNKLISRVG